MQIEKFKSWIAKGIAREGGQVKFADKHGLDRAILSLVMTGKRKPSEAFLKSLGWRKIVTYQKQKESK